MRIMTGLSLSWPGEARFLAGWFFYYCIDSTSFRYSRLGGARSMCIYVYVSVWLGTFFYTPP